MRTIKLIALLALLGCSLMAQYQPNVQFVNGSTSGLVSGPWPACPVVFNWCASLNTTEYLWFFLSTSDSNVNVFEVSATYLDVAGNKVTLSQEGAVVKGATVICLTLPYPAALQSASLRPIIAAQATSTILFQ